MVYLFDVDGTLTPSRQKMDEEFADYFTRWVKQVTSREEAVFLVAGSDLETVKEQVPNEVTEACSGIFCSSANECWIGGKLQYRRAWSVPTDLLETLKNMHAESNFSHKAEKYVDERPGMINFSLICGEKDLFTRVAYNHWDAKYGERERWASEIEDKFPDLQTAIGGQVSIDIYPKGANKSQASKWVREGFNEKMIFFGDKCRKGGNDYDLCLDLDVNADGLVFEVSSWRETQHILKEFSKSQKEKDDAQKDSI